MSKTRIGKRVASLLLSLVMMLSLLPTTVYATGGTGETNGAIVEETNTSDDNTVGGTTGNPELTGEDEGGGGANVGEGETATVATIGSATYESLDEAITAVADGQTIVVNAGEYTLNGNLNYTGKAFTIAAAEGAKVSFDMSAAVALHGAKITFNNVTFDYKTNGNYIGLQHADTLVYNNCTINGVVFLYAVNETFNSCKFYQDSADAYNVWTYGAQNVAFNGCTFNCVGKAVLVYNEGAVAKTDLTVENTEFNASAPVAGKAAIEIDTSLMAGGATITVDDKTTATGFAAGSKSGSTLWNDKKQTADTNKNTTVTVAGEKVFEPKATASAVATTKDGREYATLTEALAAVTESNPLTSVTEEAWPAATPVYYNGSFYATIGELLYDAQQKTDAIAPENAPDTAVIYCRPGTTIPTGKASHPSFVTSTTIYGNGATLSGSTEWDVENYYTLTKDITINLYSLNGGASVWGTRRSDYAVTVNMVDCKDAHEVLFNYGSGNGRVDVTVKDSTFLKSGGAAHGWPVSINCLGSLLVDGCTFDGVTTGVVVNVKQPSENGKMAVTVKNSTFNDVTGQDSNKGALRVTGQQACDIDLTIENVAFTGTHADPEDITIGNVKSEENLGKVSYNISGTDASMTTHKAGATEAAKETLVSGTTYTGTNAATAAGDGTEANPYTLEQLGAMTRQAYIDAQNRLNGIMYVTVGDYAYDTNGVLGNGVRDDTTGQIPDHSKLNAYGENGYLGEKNDGANGKSVVFVGGSITSGVTGYTSIDKIGTSLLLALPAYTNVTFKGTTFNNVMSFNYQLYTSPWSQLGELKFDGCTFNGIIVGAIAAQTLTFNGCEFKNYTNTTDANSSNPTWIRPAYGNWTQGDNEGQGSDFRSLTTINFTDNKVTSTRPVKFEYISQWDITSTVTATGNSFDISKQDGDTTIKNVGLYLGAHTDANAFNLVAENNTKSANTAALYTIPEGKTSLPLGSTVKNLAGEPVELTDALKWKAGDAEADKIVLKTVEAVASVGSKQYGSLQAAIDAATAEQTVTLLADATEDVTIDKNITLDLGGKTLTNTGAGKATVTIAKGATATVQNGSIIGGTSYYNIQNNGTATFTGVTATAGNTGSSMIDNFGTLTIESGSYTGGLDTIKNEPGAKLTISGGEFTLTKGTSKGFTGVVFNYGDLTITGGTFTQSDKSAPYGQAQVIHTDNKSGSSAPSTVITGGTFKNLCTRSTAWVVRATNAAAGATKVSGGTFNKSISDGYCADGFIPTKNADGTYGVKAGKYVAQIGSKKYETLADAIRLAAKGKTITLLDNVTENVEIAANKNLTLDLNGFTLNGGTGTAKAALYNLGTITIQDSSAAKTGTIKRDDAGIEGETSYYVIRNQGTMTIESGNVINNSGYRKVNSTGSMVGSSLICNGDCDEGGTLTIKGGTFTQNNFIAIKNGVLGVLKVTGGTITSNHSAIQNWFEADITGGKITGQLWTDAWEEGKSVGKTTIGGDATFAGEIVMDITGSVAPTLAINGGNLNVTRWRITNAAANAGAKPAVSGGTFSSAVKEEYCATGYIPTANADGTYGVKAGAYVAKVDNVKYETLQAAINAAKGGSTVRLLADVTLTETAVFPAGKKVDLNLMGHNITATGTALRINGTTDIQSTGGVGTIESTGNVAVAVGNNAKVTVYSGTLKGREGAVITGKSTGATIEIRYNATLIATDNAVIAGNGSQRDGKPNTILVKGSTFIGGIVTDGYIACGIYAPWNDNVTVSGGTFNITNGAGIVARAGTVKVTGGTFNCTGTAEGYVGDSKNKVPCAALVFDEAANYPALTESSQILVSGGSFSTDPAVNGATLAAGYVANKDESGMYKVAKANPVAAIGDVKYDTLQAAITAAQDTKDGATITLLTDINTSSYYEVKGENPVTIDLAGHNITGSGISGLFYVTAKGDLTIKGEGTVTAVEDNGAAMAVWVRSPIAKVTLEGGTYTQQITNTADPHFDLIYVERGNVYVEGGTYKGFTPDWTLNCYDEHYQSKEANIEVTGGTFVGFDPANNKAEGENTNFVPAGYVSTKGADGNYTVEEYKPVEVWTGYSGAKVASYATVAEAAEKLDGNKWIVIGKDYTLTEDFTIGGENLDNLYLDVAEGATLTVAEGVTLTVAANAKRLGVRDGATLVNKGTIVVCGSSTSNGFAMLYGTFTGNELTVPEGCFLDNNGKNFFATANENAVYEITFGDGTVKKTADSTNIKGGNVKQIKLLKDVTNGGWTLDSSSVGAEVVLDLNGHTISYNGANRYYATLNVYTKVTIKNGTVKYEGCKRGAIDLVGQGDLTIERDVTIDGGDGFAIFTSGTSKLTVNGKVTANGNYAIAGNGSKDAGGYIDSCDIIVNGGAVISASKGIAIYHPEKGTVTINGGTITGHTGIEMCAGQLVVNGGSITSNGDNMDATGSQNAILDGAAISIINRNYPGGVPTAVIKGGTFAANGKDAQTVKAYDYTGDKVAEWTAAGDNVNISGGTFSSIPTNMGVLCADGYKTVYDAYADMYNVVKQDAKITVGKRLSIGNDLTITYLVSMTDCTNPWVKFQFYNDDIKGYTTVEVKNYGTDTVTGPDGKPMDVFTFDFTGINPQRMTDTLKATVYAKDANGNVVEYQVDDYSVAQYCSNKLAKLGQNDPLRKLIGNLVAYGAAAQVYQNYRTDNLVSTVVSGAVSTDYTDRLSSVTQYTEKVLGTAGVNIKGKTLVLSNTFAVRVYFTVNKGVDIANVSFNVTANGKTDTVNSFEKDEKLGYYYFDYANLNATQLDSEVKFESFVNETGVGDMVTYSVNTYLAKKMPNYDKSSNAYKLMAELFNYGCACTEYASK